MSDANFASLSSTLLARKGGAKPAMRPQSAALGPVDGVAAAANLEDLGWNDMGEDAPQPANFDPSLDEGAERRIMPKAPSLAESSLIKSRSVEDFDSAELGPDNDQGNDDEPSEGAEIVSINTKATEDAPSANQVRESLDKIASQLGQQDAEEPVAKSTEALLDATSIAAPKKSKKPAKRSSAASKGKRAAFTLRLDPQRHLMLRLACTVRGSSAQQLVTDALDGLLAEMPEIASLAAQVQRSSH